MTTNTLYSLDISMCYVIRIKMFNKLLVPPEPLNRIGQLNALHFEHVTSVRLALAVKKKIMAAFSGGHFVFELMC